MKLVLKAVILGAITEAIVWLDALVHPVGQGPMAMPSPLFLLPHYPAMALLEPWYFAYPDWVRRTLFLLVSCGVWALVWAGLLWIVRAIRTKPNTD